MTRIILAQLRRRLGRSVALMLGILVATTGFTVLLADTSAAKLQATSTVNANARAAYDILVRPAGTVNAEERDGGLVRPNFLSGQYGGISKAAWRDIQRIPGIDVAAPIAMYGYARAAPTATIDLTDRVDPSQPTQVLQVDRVWRADRGLSTIADPATQYVYMTRRPVVWPIISPGSPGTFGWSDGRSRPGLSQCSLAVGADGDLANFNPIEIEPDGSERSLCQPHTFPGDYDASAHPSLMVVQVLPDGTFRTDGQGAPATRLTLDLPMPMYLLLAGVDPDSEAKLVGLDRATVSGHYLPSASSMPAAPTGTGKVRQLPIPVLAATTPHIDENLAVSVSRVGVPTDANLAWSGWAQTPPALPPGLTAAPRDHLGDTTFTADTQYQQMLTNVAARPDPTVADLIGLVRAGAPQMTRGQDGALVPTAVPAPNPAEVAGGVSALSTLLPPFLTDTAFRHLTTSSASTAIAPGSTQFDVQGNLVGTFDPARLTGFSQLSAVPMETYLNPDLAAADQHSRDLLGGAPLAPDSDPAGYLASPPLLLTTLDAPIFNTTPISAIRVRVAGVTGVDPVSRERVRLAAQQIQAATGLNVDITIGASPTARTVALPAGTFGRPALRLTEPWTKKGVAVSIIHAVDRKSVVLFGLILLVCVLFLANAVSAAVRDRRRELAVLACLGWPRRRLALLIAGEVTAIGIVAGTLSTAIAIPVADLARVSLGAIHALAAIPVALGLAVVATLVPAARAARSRPGTAIAPLVVAPRFRRRGRRRTIAGMAAANLWRTPGRTVLGAAALALGVAAVTVLTAVTWAFHGAITGTLLGDAVSLQVRGVDRIAVAAIVALGLVAVADVLYLNVRDRAAELAALRATGWSQPALARLITYEGLGIGALGAVVGAAGGLAAAANFAGTLTPDLGWLAAAAAMAAVVAAGIAATVPALMQRHLPIATLLAEET